MATITELTTSNSVRDCISNHILQASVQRQHQGELNRSRFPSSGLVDQFQGFSSPVRFFLSVQSSFWFTPSPNTQLLLLDSVPANQTNRRREHISGTETSDHLQ